MAMFKKGENSALWKQVAPLVADKVLTDKMAVCE